MVVGGNFFGALLILVMVPVVVVAAVPMTLTVLFAEDRNAHWSGIQKTLAFVAAYCVIVISAMLAIVITVASM